MAFAGKNQLFSARHWPQCVSRSMTNRDMATGDLDGWFAEVRKGARYRPALAVAGGQLARILAATTTMGQYSEICRVLGCSKANDKAAALSAKNLLQNLHVFGVVPSLAGGGSAYPQAVGAEAVLKLVNLTEEGWYAVLTARAPGSIVVSVQDDAGLVRDVKVHMPLDPELMQFWSCQLGKIVAVVVLGRLLPDSLKRNSAHRRRDEECAAACPCKAGIIKLYRRFTKVEGGPASGQPVAVAALGG